MTNFDNTMSTEMEVIQHQGRKDNTDLEAAMAMALRPRRTSKISSTMRRRNLQPPAAVKKRSSTGSLKAFALKHSSLQASFVSIGPYHHGSPDLQPMETSKCAVLKDLCEQTGVTVADLVHSLHQEVKDPRQYYRQKIDDVVGDEALSALLLIDGCFLFSYMGGLRRRSTAATSSSSSQPQPPPHVYSVDSSIHHDILLLENQVPYAVLKAIGSAICCAQHSTNSVDDSINKLACGFIKGVFQYIPTAAAPKGFDHLVDLCYQFLRPSSLTICEDGGHLEIAIPNGEDHEAPQPCEEGQLEKAIFPHGEDHETAQQPEVRRLRRATEYRETGIRFKQRRKINVRKEPAVSLVDIRFSGGELQIPRLVIDERTDYLFRNMIAYEQERFDSLDSYVTAYVLFMSQLLSKAEDVTLLSEKDILVHQLGSDEEVSEMFRKMSKGVVFDFDGEYHLKDVTVALERHYRDRRNRWMALLRHTYFSNPWLILGAVVAMVAFALSVSQAALNFLRFARHPK